MIASKPRRIWIVDDSPIDAERARRALDGYDVQVFPDGSAALERLGAEPPPDVMVLDWTMPGITGVEVCRFLRSGVYASSPIGIILITVHRAVQQIVEGLSAGANDYLPKPFQEEELRARVRSQIRARELLERALDAEDLNRRLLESAPDAILALDERGVVSFANQEARRVFGLSANSPLGMSLSPLKPTLWARSMRESSEPYQTLPDVELNGRVYSPTLRVPQTPTSGMTISLRDVTERRKADARRLDFYSIIAHDLRSPLNAMSLRADLILGGKHGALPAALLADVEKIKGSIQAQVRLINDFLQIARFEGSPLAIEREAVDMTALVDTVTEGLRPLLEAGSLSWVRVVPPAGAGSQVLGDAQRLAQVVANLLGNAIKFTPPEGVITTRVVCADTSVELVVEDTGPGVPADALPTLFDRYTRADDQGSDVTGSGLGLMIVREIVEAHGGTYGVTSDVGIGSRFWVRLPSVDGS